MKPPTQRARPRPVLLQRALAGLAVSGGLLLLPAQAAWSDSGGGSFEAYPTTPGDARLPPELRRSTPDPVSVSDLGAWVAPDQDVEIRWMAREAPELRAYCVTVRIDAGPLAGMAARWTVGSGTGEPAPEGYRTYRLKLPVPVAGTLRLRTSIEAMRNDGSMVMLGLRESAPASDGTSRQWQDRRSRHLVCDSDRSPAALSSLSASEPPAPRATSLLACSTGLAPESPGRVPDPSRSERPSRGPPAPLA